ncbi:hypothetical protein LU351_20435 [Marinibactrum halimedae]|nr:hypothetical protein [Marinibactrum halimedae]
MNTYGYAYQNPINNFDPDGRLVWFGVPAYYLFAGGAALTAGGACIATNCGQTAYDNAAAVADYLNESSEGPVDTFEAQSEYLRYKDFCNNPPPPTGERCKDMRERIKWMQQCRNMRQQWDDRYKPGNHSDHIRRMDRDINKLKRVYNNAWSCRNEPLDCD